MGADTGIPRECGHTPVLLEQCLQLLAPAFLAVAAAGRSPVLLDATVGLGGHAEAALASHSRLRLVGLDRDPQALASAAARLARYGSRVELRRAVYDQLTEVLDELDIAQVDGVLFDLGVSSLQLDSAERGFAYAYDAPLDMRMDPDAPLSAAEVVNTYPAAQLARILREYGEERFATRIAAAIVRQRERAALASTAQLAQLVRESIPAAARRTGGNPAKRTFQALRIEVNGELDALTRALPAAIDALAPGGRIAILSYHSLEDRIAKRELAQRARSRAPAGLPVEPPGMGPTLRLLTRGAQRPDAAEVAANPRARAARLRAAERLAGAAAGEAAQERHQQRHQQRNKGRHSGEHKPPATGSPGEVRRNQGGRHGRT